MHRKLTVRQKEILELLSKGKTIAEIANELYLSVNTVRRHLSAIYDTLNVKSQSQAVVYYLNYLKDQERTSAPGHHAELTKREEQVYSLYLKGLTSKQIGALLAISDSTAREYLRRSRAKLSET